MDFGYRLALIFENYAEGVKELGEMMFSRVVEA